MSFKVYTGIKITGVDTLADAQQFIESIRSLVIPIVHKIKAKEIKMVACLLYDQYHAMGIDAFDPKDMDRVPMITSLHRIDELYQQEYKKRGKDEYTISIISVDGHTLGIPFFQDKESYQKLLDHPQVSGFGYWDNTDPDENASEEEWELRGTLWNKVFDDITVPAEAMLGIRLVNSGFVSPDDEFMHDLPTVADREEALANTLALDTPGEKSMTYSEIIKRHKELIGDYLEKVKGKLNPELTMKDLGKTVPRKETKPEKNNK